MQPDVLIFQISILIFSVVIHEVSHGYMAEWLGDPTARLAGRLTLNPLKHLDPLGSVIIPGILLLSNSGFLIGWAKPVPYNPYNLKNQRWGEALVAGSGPLVNIFIAVIFAIVIRISMATGAASAAFVEIASFVVLINVLLAIFNLIPFPPLDGSKVFAAFLPYHVSSQFMSIQNFMARYGLFGSFLFIFLFIFFLWPIFSKLIFGIFHLLTGL